MNYEIGARIQSCFDALKRIDIDPNTYPVLKQVIAHCASSSNIIKIDHVTFICSPERREAFLSHWQKLGFAMHGIWETVLYPAEHIALIRGITPEYPWQEMVGLSVEKTNSTVINQPLRQSVQQDVDYQLQHVAFNISPLADVESLYLKMQNEWQLQLMTPILYYTDSQNAGLRQWFTRPSEHFFIEFVQRISNQAGIPYGGFDTKNIDDLYKSLEFELSNHPV